LTGLDKKSILQGNPVKEVKGMHDFMKKAVLVGAGLAVMTTEKLKELTEELVRKGDLSEKEAREALEELKERSLQARKEWEQKIADAVEDFMRRLNVPSRREVEELKERLARLEEANKPKSQDATS